MILNHHTLNASSTGGAIPEHCVLLDYFTENNHYGSIKRNPNYADYPTTTGIISNNNYDNLGSTYFDLSKSKFKNGIPYAKFYNYGTGGKFSQSELLLFSGLNNTNFPQGISIECLMSVDYNANFCQCWQYDPMNNFSGIRGDSSSVGSYLCNGSSFGFNGSIGQLKQVVGNGVQAKYWHHYAYSIDFVNKKHYLFLDGNLAIQLSNNLSGGSIGINPCCIDTNNGSSKLNSAFYMTQLVVWDYPKYTTNFTIPNKPYI